MLKIKRLISTSFAGSKVAKSEFNPFPNGDGSAHGYVLDVTKFSKSNSVFTEKYVEELLKKTDAIHELIGDGDFRSEECFSYLEEADIVVTNPPFSLFREMVSELISRNKKFLIIGNQNALTYKEIFPLIRDGIVWTGYQFGEMKFRVPSTAEPHSTRYWVDGTGQKWRSLGNAMWLTNLDIERHHEWLELKKTYSPDTYPHYDNYDAINVRYVRDIPMDYPGIMGVPITIINKFNRDQFEIIGEANHGSDNEYDLFKPTINGKEIFKRILIRNKHPLTYKERNV